MPCCEHDDFCFAVMEAFRRASPHQPTWLLIDWPQAERAWQAGWTGGECADKQLKALRDEAEYILVGQISSRKRKG